MQIHSSTKITFPGGATSASTKILASKKWNDDEVILVTETTPFHPLDYNWPDQPSDKGTIKLANAVIPIKNCLVAAIHSKTQEFVFDLDIKNKKIRRDDPDWFFLVAHLIDANRGLEENLVGREVFLEVDETYRAALSKIHSAVHLAALALNKVTQSFWNKSPEYLDSFGHPSLDAEAIVESKITPEESSDRYRCGKSLRKKGFDCAKFFNDHEFQQVEKNLNQELLQWYSHANGIKIFVTPEVAYLHEKRMWHCVLPNGNEAQIPCGGTHAAKISSPEKIIVELKREGDAEFIMHTRVKIDS